MDVALLIVSFLCFGVGVAGLMASWNMGITCKAMDLSFREQLRDASIEFDKQRKEMDAEKEELKKALAIVSKVHNERINDIKPLKDELETLRIRLAAATPAGRGIRG